MSLRTLWIWVFVWVGAPWSARRSERNYAAAIARCLVAVADAQAGRPLTIPETRNLLDHFGIWASAQSPEEFQKGIEHPGRMITRYFLTADWPNPTEAVRIHVQESQ